MSKIIHTTENLKEFYCENMHNTGTSYVKALEGESKLSFSEIESAYVYLKSTLDGFLNEIRGEHRRWEYLSTQFISNYINIVDQGNLTDIKEMFYKNKSIDVAKNFDIKLSIEDSKYSIKVKTYAHINLSLGAMPYMSETILKRMIANKLNKIHNLNKA